MLMSELAHMRKLYNDIIYFVQNHVKPVTPSNSYPSSLLLSSSNNSNVNGAPLFMQKQQQQGQNVNSLNMNNVEDNGSRTKLFGVPLLSKKRLHPEYGNSNNNNAATMVETHKARLVLENDDLGLNLMPPSPC